MVSGPTANTISKGPAPDLCREFDTSSMAGIALARDIVGKKKHDKTAPNLISSEESSSRRHHPSGGGTMVWTKRGSGVFPE